jgi:transposase InsO family protein
VGRVRQRFYQFTAIDEATRFRVLRIYDHNNTKTAMDFLREGRDHFPSLSKRSRQITIRRSDRSSLGIFRIGKVESSHKTDSEKFYRGRSFKNKKEIPVESSELWETQYNEDRPHLALKGKTPAETVRELGRQPQFAKDPS